MTSTHWIGPIPDRVAAEVPPDVIATIETYEAARQRQARANERYMVDRSQEALTSRSMWLALMDQAWCQLQRLLVKETGWYPVNGRIYGYAKRDNGGLKLVREPGYSRWPDEIRAWRYGLVEREKERAERQIKAFCTAHNGARGHGRQDHPEITV